MAIFFKPSVSHSFRTFGLNMSVKSGQIYQLEKWWHPTSHLLKDFSGLWENVITEQISCTRWYERAHNRCLQRRASQTENWIGWEDTWAFPFLSPCGSRTRDKTFKTRTTPEGKVISYSTPIPLSAVSLKNLETGESSGFQSRNGVPSPNSSSHFPFLAHNYSLFLFIIFLAFPYLSL